MPRAKSAVSKTKESREGKVPVAAYLDPAFREQIKIMSAKERRDIQDLLAEALNLLFKKYGYEQVVDQSKSSSK